MIKVNLIIDKIYFIKRNWRKSWNPFHRNFNNARPWRRSSNHKLDTVFSVAINWQLDFSVGKKSSQFRKNSIKINWRICGWKINTAWDYWIYGKFHKYDQSLLYKNKNIYLLTALLVTFECQHNRLVDFI